MNTRPQTSLFKRLWEALLFFLFPSRCVVCRTPGTALCETCTQHIEPSPDDPPHSFIRAYFRYRTPEMKRALWYLKYRGNHLIARPLAGLLYDALLEDIAEERTMHAMQNPLLVPIPMSAKRLRERGYNHTEVLSNELSDRDGGASFKPAHRVLYKITDTRSQMTIKDKQERMRNIRESFGVKNPALVRGRDIIVLDDITTTGATLAEARRVLKKAGARRVICIAIAH